MTYWQLHLRLNLPFLLIAALAACSAAWSTATFLTFVLIILMVVLFAAMWDHLAIARGLWSFPPDRVRHRLFSVPLPEYAFFLIQSAQVLGLTHAMTRLRPLRLAKPLLLNWGVLAAAGVVWVILCAVARACLPRRFSYCWHLLAWFLPVAIFHWLLAGPLLASNLPNVLGPSALAGAWLCVVDWIAIRERVWVFDPTQLLGWEIAAVPIEEILFFFLSCGIIAQSYVMLLPAFAALDR